MHPNGSSVLTVRLEPPTSRLVRGANHCATSPLITHDWKLASPFQKLQSEIDMLESSLETAHATIKALQSQLPQGSNDDVLIQQVCYWLRAIVVYTDWGVLLWILTEGCCCGYFFYLGMNIGTLSLSTCYIICFVGVTLIYSYFF